VIEPRERLTVQHLALSKECLRLSEKISDQTDFKSALDVQTSVLAQVMLGLTIKSYVPLIDAYTTLVKFLAASLTANPVSTVAELDGALPSLELSEILTIREFTNAGNLILYNDSFMELSSIRVEFADEPVEIPVQK